MGNESIPTIKIHTETLFTTALVLDTLAEVLKGVSKALRETEAEQSTPESPVLGMFVLKSVLLAMATVKAAAKISHQLSLGTAKSPLYHDAYELLKAIAENAKRIEHDPKATASAN